VLLFDGPCEFEGLGLGFGFLAGYGCVRKNGAICRWRFRIFGVLGSLPFLRRLGRRVCGMPSARGLHRRPFEGRLGNVFLTLELELLGERLWTKSGQIGHHVDVDEHALVRDVSADIHAVAPDRQARATPTARKSLILERTDAGALERAWVRQEARGRGWRVVREVERMEDRVEEHLACAADEELQGRERGGLGGGGDGEAFAGLVRASGELV
jgi:hypothetical protein